MMTSPTCQTGRTKQQSYNGDYMAVGAYAEAIVAKNIEKIFKGAHIKNDVRSDRAWQRADVDFLLGVQGLKGFIPVDVKSDKHLGRSSNVLVELRRNYLNGTIYEGWFTRSKAKYILYYAPLDNSVLVLNLPKLRAYVAAKPGHYTEKTVWSDNSKTTTVLLIPLVELEGSNIVRKVQL